MREALGRLLWGDVRGMPPSRRVLACGLRGAAAVLEKAYGASVAARERLYAQHPDLARRLPVATLCLGNLTLGGTGKTPAVEWLCREITALGGRPLIASRGYGRGSSDRNEEALLLERLLPGVPHVQGKDRHAAALEGLRRHGADCVVLDDGFQHRRLARDLDIVLVDCTDPFGGGRLLPRGRLREPPEALARAGAVILTRSDAVASADRERIARDVGALTEAPLACAVHRPRGLRMLAGTAAGGPERLSGERVFLASGIGNPGAFRRTAEGLGASVVGERAFPDHHPYVPADLARIRAEAASAGARGVVTTEKDAVKLGAFPDAGGLPVWALEVRFEVVEGAGRLRESLRSVLGKARG